MKRFFTMLCLFMFLSASESFVFADTYSATTTDGTTFNVTIAPKAYALSGGKSEIRAPGTWTYSKESATMTNGVIYPMSWLNYQDDISGNLYENQPSQGAMVAIMFAPPSSGCSAGAIMTAFIEMPKASGVANPGSEINLTPANGFICGSQISSFTTYVLTAATTVNISGSKTTTSTSAAFDFTGSYKSNKDATTMTLKQTGTSLTGTATQSTIKFAITGTVSGGMADVSVVTTGNNCTGSGSGKLFYLRNNSILSDVRAATTSACGGTMSGLFDKQ